MPFSLGDLEFGQVLGDGSYSKVVLAKEKASRKSFAVKIMPKKFTEEAEAEIAALKCVQHHPNVIGLEDAIVDGENYYLILENAEEGSIYDHVHQNGPCTIKAAAFYLAELVLALEHLHERCVYHRDVKPENLLLDKNAHLKLSDFGTAKEFPGDDEYKSSFVGTAEYLCPELLRDVPQVNASSDLWGLGCVLYFMLTAHPPFQDKSEYLIFQRIRKLEYTIPDTMDAQAKHLIQSLLKTNPEDRLGSKQAGGIAKLKLHPFFKEVAFDSLNKQSPPMLHELLLSPKQHAQPTSVWDKFLLKNESILHTSRVIKVRKLTRKKRQLILTTFPRIIYVDYGSMEMRGEIPCSAENKYEVKGKQSFNIITPKRTFYFEQVDDPLAWVMALKKATAE